MSTKSDVMFALHATNRSLVTLAAAALQQEQQTELILRQGQSVTQSLGQLTEAIGVLTDRLSSYLDNADRQGGRINTLEREMREMRVRDEQR